MDVLLVSALLLLHRIDGGEVWVNPDQITSLHTSGGGPRVLHGRVRCAIWLSDGRLLSVAESCDQVKQLLRRAP